MVPGSLSAVQSLCTYLQSGGTGGRPFLISSAQACAIILLKASTISSKGCKIFMMYPETIVLSNKEKEPDKTAWGK